MKHRIDGIGFTNTDCQLKFIIQCVTKNAWFQHQGCCLIKVSTPILPHNESSFMLAIIFFEKLTVFGIYWKTHVCIAYSIKNIETC